MERLRRPWAAARWLGLLGLALVCFVPHRVEARDGYVRVFTPVARACAGHVLRRATGPNHRAGAARVSEGFLAMLRAAETASRPARKTAEAEGEHPVRPAYERARVVKALFNLPWGERYFVDLYLRLGPCGGFVWWGRVPQAQGPPAHFILTVYKGVCGLKRVDPGWQHVVATIAIGCRMIEVLPVDRYGVYLIREPIPRRKPDCVDLHLSKVEGPGPHVEKAAAVAAEESKLDDCPVSKFAPRVDVLVVYTPGAVEIAQDSETALRAWIHNAAETMNAALEDSHARACIRVVGCRPTAWDPVITKVELLTLIAGTAASPEDDDDPPTPAQLAAEEIHDWRDELSADVVVLVTGDSPEDEANGWSPRLGSCPGARCKVWDVDLGPCSECAYALVNANTIVGSYTMAHELGHHFGCGHESCDYPIAPFALSASLELETETRPPSRTSARGPATPSCARTSHGFPTTRRRWLPTRRSRWAWPTRRTTRASSPPRPRRWRATGDEARGASRTRRAWRALP